MNFYKDRVMLNVLGGSLENAKEVYQAAEKHVLVGVLSANYPTVEDAVEDMRRYNEALEGNLSVGLGGGNPAQWKAVGDIARQIKCNHYNQVFTAVAYTRANVGNDEALINCLVSPSGRPGEVVISTGPASKDAKIPAIVNNDTAIAMMKDMGATSVKFFPMHGLACKEELKAVAEACARNDFILEPTGGIDLENFKEILEIALNAGVKKIIPHVYSSIIDKATGNTDPAKVIQLMEIVKQLVD